MFLILLKIVENTLHEIRRKLEIFLS